MLCSATHGPSPLSGVVVMYLLMSAFHSAPWLKPISRRRSGPRLVKGGERADTIGWGISSTSDPAWVLTHIRHRQAIGKLRLAWRSSPLRRQA
jgi:hypothetical protein